MKEEEHPAHVALLALSLIMCVVLGLQGYALGQAQDRIKALEQRAILEDPQIIGRLTLLEEQHARCAADQAAWHKWLALRAAGYGSAWFFLETAP